MSGKKKRGASLTASSPRPNVLHDTQGAYIIVTCGSLSGNLYLRKLDESNRSQSKCVVISGKWYSPPEFETLAGKKAKKWRQSIHHQGKPLSFFLTSGSLGIQGYSHDSQVASAGLQVVDPSPSTSHVSLPPCDENSCFPVPQPPLVNSVLSFIKAFRLKGDVATLKRVVSERFSYAAVESAKKDLWSFCQEKLLAANLAFHARRDSDKRSQLSANLFDIIQAFDALDSTDSIPSIYCEANDLLFMPPLSLDPTAEQVHQNTEILQSLVAQVESLERKLPPSSPCASPPSFAQVASSQAVPTPTHPAPLKSQSVHDSSISDSRACNLVLFGLAENDSILQLKSEIDEVLEFLAGKPVAVSDVFRLGRYSASAKRPRPVLIKLATAWDRKVILLHKRNLKGFSTSRLFLREDVPPDHKLRQKRPSLDTAVQPPSAPSVALEPSNPPASPSTDPQRTIGTDASILHHTLDVAPPLPPSVSHSSSSSDTTVIQGPAVQHGST